MRRIDVLTRATVAALVLGAGPASAQQAWISPSGIDSIFAGKASAEVVLILDSSLRLSDVSATELLGTSANALDAGAARVAMAPTLAASLGDPATPMAVSDTVHRTLDPVYRAWARNVSGNLNDVRVSYEITAPSGARDRLEHAVDPDRHLGLRVTPTGPVQIDKDGPWRLLQGGGVFTLDTRDATVSGPYRGTLTVVINIL